MFPTHHQAQLDLGDFRVLEADFEEDDEMAAARDVVTADLKCFQECDAIRDVPHASTPPPVLQLQQHLQGPQYFKQEASGAAGSSCGASSPQASCDTAAAANKAQQQFWPSAQQYDAYNPMLAHLSASSYPAGFMQDTPYAASTSAVLAMAGMPCTGPCCYPQGPLVPQGSCSLSAGMVGSAIPPPVDYCFSPHGSMQGYAGAGMYPTGAGSGSMVPHGAFSTAGMIPCNNSSSAPAGLPSAAPAQQPSRQQLQRGYSSYLGVLQGGVQKRSSTVGANTTPVADTAIPMPHKSADGSCSSKDGSPAQLPRARKGSKGAAAAAGSGSAGRSRGSSLAASGAGSLAVSGSAATLIKELQEEVSRSLGGMRRGGRHGVMIMSLLAFVPLARPLVGS